MSRILPIESDGKAVGYCFKCPACGYLHQICTADAHREGWPVWELSGTADRPTIRDSILVTGEEGEDHHPTRFHSYVTDGYIKFDCDSLHSMAGQTVELPEFPENWPHDNDL